MYVLIHGTHCSLSDWLHSVRQTLGSSTSPQMTLLHSCEWPSSIPFCMLPHFLYPFLCYWTFRFPHPGYHKRCWNEHWGTCVLLDYGFFQGMCPVVGLLDHMVVLCLVFFFGSIWSWLQHMGSSLHHTGSFIVACMPSCPAACGIIVLWPGIEPVPRYPKARS